MDHSDNEETNIDIVCQTTVNEYFDQVIGHIEDIVLSDTFQNLHEQFLERNWFKFEDNEENKLEYMDVFEEYTTTFETFFIEELNKCMEDFDMEKFAQELNSYDSTTNSLGFVDSEIFELLYSFSNFQIFKDLMLDYRRKKEGRVQHLDFNILTTKPLFQTAELLEATDK
ncbi:ADP-ribosylation factor-like protein 2-binding protein [Lucilia cuprina]|uniref:ADP-ribosylation factor-like protein 2-binding protein n=1 Tax=Lucilia cuprina TaxID=7375 RepID=UPI001F0592AC|nr:ADP-ribosylation factor-like protein 2-binding protein [Lucilia cuprina]